MNRPLQAEASAQELMIRAAAEAGDYDRATELLVETYGSELLSFMATQLRDWDAGNDAFSELCEQFWSTLSRFEWRCSARTWAYKLARRIMSAHLAVEARRRVREVPLSRTSAWLQAVERLRSATAPYQRTDSKDQSRELRARLDPADLTVIVLRVDRGLSFLELAEVMLSNADAPSDEALRTEAARLRKRFQLAKQRLRVLAREQLRERVEGAAAQVVHVAGLPLGHLGHRVDTRQHREQAAQSACLGTISRCGSPRETSPQGLQLAS